MEYFFKRFSLLSLCILFFSICHNALSSNKSDFKNYFFDKEISGVVRDSTGTPLPGVTVQVKGDESIATSSDIDGNYTLTVPDDAIIVFSMVGFDDQEINVEGRDEINVAMQSGVTGLDETVIVAFGKQKKEDVVGSITTVNPDELKVPSSNLTTAMAGKVPGMIAFQRSGAPGQDNAEFFIRGVTTFGYKKDPLIMIDGIESTSDDLARLQTDNIANFSILKDATATALYGSRAANGVILIETKEGKKGKAKVSLRLENSISTPTREVDFADPITYMELANEAVTTRDPLGVTPYSSSKIDNTAEGVNPYMYPTTDWRGELIKDYTMNQRANLNVSGGGEVAQYYFAGSVTRDNGILEVDPQNNFNSNIELITYSLRSNVNVNLTKTTDVAVKLSGTFDDYSGPIHGGNDMYEMIMRTDPVRFPAAYPKDEEHKHVKHILFGNYDDGSDEFFLNPYAELMKGYKEHSRSVMNAQFRVNQDLDFLTKGLNINMMVHTQRYSFFDVTRKYKPFWYQASGYDRQEDTFSLNVLNEDDGEEFLSYDEGEKITRSNFKFETNLSYNHIFNKKHGFRGNLIFLAQNRLDGNAGDLQSSLPFRNVGLAGRASYTYDKRYNVEFDFGYNASERFHEKYRWGFFPSYGASWNISNEKFWEGLKPTVNNLKLRATYGYAGNDEIGSPNDRFLYLSNVNMNNDDRGAVFGTENSYSRPGISLSRYGNSGITWEKAIKTNIGLDIELFDAWSLTAEVYREDRSNILMDRVATPSELGLSATPQANIGKTQSKGIDLDFQYEKSFANGLWVQSMANFTYASGKFVTYEEYDYKDAPWKSREGYPINQQWGYLAERLFIDDEEAANAPTQNFGEYGGGDIKYRDINDDGQITTLDQVPIGYPTTPEIVYGFGVSAGYKGFDLSVFFQGLARESFWIDPNATAPFIEYGDNPGKAQNQLLGAYADDHWSENNRDSYALWPRLSDTGIGNNNNFQRSTWFMRDGSFLRLKQLEVGYTFPDEWSEKLFMQNLRLYVNGTNLLNWSNFKLWDVEMGGNGLGYPIQRVFNIGLKMDF